MRDRSAEAGDARRQAGEGAVRRSLGAEDALAAAEAGGGAVSHAAALIHDSAGMPNSRSMVKAILSPTVGHISRSIMLAYFVLQPRSAATAGMFMPRRVRSIRSVSPGVRLIAMCRHYRTGIRLSSPKRKKSEKRWSGAEMPQNGPGGSGPAVGTRFWKCRFVGAFLCGMEAF